MASPIYSQETPVQFIGDAAQLTAKTMKILKAIFRRKVYGSFLSQSISRDVDDT